MGIDNELEGGIKVEIEVEMEKLSRNSVNSASASAIITDPWRISVVLSNVRPRPGEDKYKPEMKTDDVTDAVKFSSWFPFFSFLNKPEGSIKFDWIGNFEKDFKCELEDRIVSFKFDRSVASSAKDDCAANLARFNSL